MKRIQITHNVVNKDVLKEIKGSMIPPWQKYMLLFSGVIAIVATILNFINHEYIFGFVLIALAIACAFEIYWLDNKKYKNVLKLMKDETEKEENIYTFIFGNDALVIRNCDMGTDNKMIYEHMRKIKETKSAYTIFGKGNQFAMIRKESLKASPKELIEFLQSKDTHIKKWPKDI